MNYRKRSSADVCGRVRISPASSPNCDRAEAKQFLEELEELLLRETIEEPDEGDLVGKVKPVMRAPALAELHEIFLD
jgi:hypothetical protein